MMHRNGCELDARLSPVMGPESDIKELGSSFTREKAKGLCPGELQASHVSVQFRGQATK